MPRLGIAIVGQGVAAHDQPLFRKLRAHGGYFSRVTPEDGFKQLLAAVAARAKAHSAPYAHWYIDGGQEAQHDAALATVSYNALESARAALLKKMRGEIDRPGMGPEALRTLLAQMRPSDLGLGTGDEILDRFRVKLLDRGLGNADLQHHLRAMGGT